MTFFVVLPRELGKDDYFQFPPAIIEGSISASGAHVLTFQPKKYPFERIPREYVKEISSIAGPARIFVGTICDKLEETRRVIAQFPLPMSHR